jgi:hypothetical protein
VRAIFFWFFGFLVRLWVLWVFLPAALIGWFAYGHWRFLGLRSAFAASAPFACGVGLSLCSCWFICVAVLPGCPAALAFPCFAFGLLALPLGCLPAALAFPCFHVGLFALPFCLVALRRWPFLVFMSVYLYCPCAGRHSLSLRPQRK